MKLFSTILPVGKDVSGTDILEAVMEWEDTKKDLTKDYEELDGIDIYHYGFAGDPDAGKLPWSQTFVFEKYRHRIFIMQDTPSSNIDPAALEKHYTTPSIITLLLERGLLSNVKKEPVEAFSKDLNLPRLVFSDKRTAQCLAFRLKGAAQVQYNPLSNDRFLLPGLEYRITPEEAVHRVLEYGRLQLAEPAYSWESIRKLAEYRDTNTRLNAALSEQNKKLLEDQDMAQAYEEEIEGLQNKIIAAHNQLSANSLKISGLENKLKDDKPLLFYGQEDDLYEGEIKDMILDLIEKEFKSIPIKTRRRDILESLLAQNEATGVGAEAISRIKTSFKGYREMNGSLKSLLESIGLLIDHSGDHYKIRFADDDRYQVVLPRTSSDHKGGDNFIATITKTMF